MNNVGQYIEFLIKENGYNQSAIAREIGVSRQIISYVISGRRDLSISLALKLESFFNLPEGELLKLQTEDSINKYKLKLKNELINDLLQVNSFWSYTNVTSDNIPDEELIEKVFVKLDMADIDKLFELYPRNFIKKVWEEKMIIQGEYLFSLNVMIALYYFNIEQPEKYIKRIEKKHQKKILNSA